MALAPGTITPANSGSVSQTGLTFSHNNNGDLLIVGFVEAGTGVTSVTYNGVAMTLALADPFGPIFDIYYLIAPAAGANNVVITLPNAVKQQAFAISFSGAHQTTPIGTTNGSNGTSTSPSTSITTVGSGSYIVDLMTYGNVGGQTLTVAGTQTQIANDSTGAKVFGASYKSFPTPGATTMTWTGLNSAQWIGGAIEIKAAASGIPNKIFQYKQAVKRASFY